MEMDEKKQRSEENKSCCLPLYIGEEFELSFTNGVEGLLWLLP